MNAVSRLTPDRHNADDVMSRLVLEAGDPVVEPRPEYIAELRALILSRLGPPRAGRPSMRLWLVASGLAAACLVVVLAWPRGDSKSQAPDLSGEQSPDPIATRQRTEPTSITAWGNVRRDLDLAELPDFSWPLQESSRLSRSTSIPADLLD
jgi:hypothetical protein